MQRFGWIVVAVLGCFLVETQSTKPCQLKAADMVFVVDASSSIWTVDFKRVLTFVKDLLSSFTIAVDKVRVGLVTFTDRPRLQWTLNQHTSKDDLMKAVEKVQQATGDTYTDVALRFLRNKLFSKAYGGRDDVVQIGILITDGKSRSKQLTLREAFLLHRLTNIQMFAIGIGADIDKDELMAIATRRSDELSSNKNYYLLSDFLALDYTLKTELAVKACSMRVPDSRASSNAGIYEPDGGVWSVCKRRTPADVVFATDPHSLGQRVSKKTMGIIRDVISALPVGPLDYRVALVPQDACAQGSAPISHNHTTAQVHDTEHGLHGAIRRVGAARSQLASYMSAIRTDILGKRDEYGGVSRRKIVVAFVDETQNTEEVETEVRKLEMSGVVTLAVGVGSKVTLDALLKVATAADLTFRDSDTEQGNSRLASDIIRGICLRHHKVAATGA